MKENELKAIEMNMYEHDEYDNCSWGSRDNIQQLVKYIRELQKKNKKTKQK